MTTRDDSYFTSSGLDFRWCWYTEFWLKPTYAGGVRGKQQANAKLNLVEIKAAIGQLVYFACDRVRSVNFKLIS
jgi:hypothetical protein